MLPVRRPSLTDFPERPFTRGALSRLGVAVREGTPFTSEVAQVRDGYDHYYSEAAQALEELVATWAVDALPGTPEVTSRAKSWLTVEAKIQQGLDLAGIRDLAGARVVLGSGGLDQQDHLVSYMQQQVDAAKVIDRRTDPRSGYRAVHLEMKLGGGRVEVQIRTRRQHQWAEVCEAAADQWGRELRYGKEPSGFTEGRRAMWSKIQELSDIIYMTEQARPFVRTTAQRVAFRHPVEAVRAVRQLRRAEQQLDTMIDAMARLIDRVA